ncbi:MAG: HDIG domain-containing protein [Armatimonadetes bacterium]|nr:HDIG domain-containing protein [Armatimonadota bacterium]
MIDQTIATIRQATDNDQLRDKLFLVGGLLRDLALGLTPEQDVDIVCLTDALGVAEHLFNAGVTDHSPVLYPRFGTAMVTVKGIPVELATARRESYSPQSRKPVVDPATLHEDVLRRDFTVNTLLRNLHTREELDLTGRAFADLQARIIRTPLNPLDTFTDDPLRMLRAVRFAAKLGFEIEKQTEDALRASVERLAIISRERIQEEFSKTLMLAQNTRGLEILRETGLLQEFAPELAQMYGVTQNEFHLYDVWTHTLKAVDNLPESADLTLRLGTLFHDIGKPSTRTEDDSGVHFYGHQHVGAEMTRTVLQRLKYSNDLIQKVERLVDKHMRIGEYNKEWSDSAVRRLVRDLGEQMEELFVLSDADKAACNPEHFYLDSSVVRERVEHVQAEQDYRRVQSPLDGREIMQLAGIGPGPKVGQYKEALINEMLEGRLSPDDTPKARSILKQLVEKDHGGQDN